MGPAFHTGGVMRDVSLLRSPYREIRAVREREDGPWTGVLVRGESGVAGVLVDAATFGPEWVGWDAEPGGHVLTPIDLVRRADGHDVLLPACAERLEDFVRRRSVRAPFTAPEAVTLGVSVLRGCAQLVGAPETTGEWWLDDSGRPVLATGSSSQRALDAAVAVLGVAAVDPRIEGAWVGATRAVSADRLTSRDLADAEQALFDVADPEPLSTVNLNPLRVGELTSDVRSLGPLVADAASRPSWQSLIGGLDGDLADTVSRATTAVWRRLRQPHRSRRAPWLVGGAVAATVLVGGALWPAAGGVATGPEASTRPSDAAIPVAEAPPEGGAPTEAEGLIEAGETPETGAAGQASPAPDVPAADADLAGVAAGLLDARTQCGGDGSCLEGVVEDASAAFGAGVVDLPASDRTLTLLDDFGDIAVLRADANDGTTAPQLVVIVRGDEKWLLRDVHDVAQQP